MGTLLYFAVLAGLFFLMMRFGCGSHVMGHGHDEHDAGARAGGADRRLWAPPETDIDPVCHTSVRTETAKSSVYHGSIYYFCSAEHRDAFEADPERYLGSRPAETRQLEHHHG